MPAMRFTVLFLIACSQIPASSPIALTRTAEDHAGIHCAHGGVATLNGHDLDRNGVLNDDEIESATYTCNNAATGERIMQQARMVNECSKIELGADANNDGVLQSDEVHSVTLHCQNAA